VERPPIRARGPTRHGSRYLPLSVPSRSGRVGIDIRAHPAVEAQRPRPLPRRMCPRPAPSSVLHRNTRPAGRDTAPSRQQPGFALITFSPAVPRVR